MRQTPGARFASFSRRRQWVLIALAVSLAAAVLAGLYLVAQKLERDSLGGDEPKGSLEGRFDDPPRVEYGGKVYEQKQRLTTILLMGLEEGPGEGQAAHDGHDGTQADLMVLLVIDPQDRTVTSIHIDPDTVAEITATGDFSFVPGIQRAQIGRQYGYGGSQPRGMTLSAQAVGRLFGGVSVDIYVLMESGAMAALNDALGGLEVRVEDDLTAYDPAMTAGSTLRLSGKQAEYYVKAKTAAQEGAEDTRTARQKIFLNAAGRALAARLLESPGYADTLLNTLKPLIRTNTGLGRIVVEIYGARDYTRKAATLQGKSLPGTDGTARFEVDRASLEAVTLELFYREVE